jgi:hypothetical protein
VDMGYSAQNWFDACPVKDTRSPITVIKVIRTSDIGKRLLAFISLLCFVNVRSYL